MTHLSNETPVASQAVTTQGQTDPTRSLEELRVKVAELAGCKRYKRPFDGRVFLCKENPQSWWEVSTEQIDVINSDVPDYPRDLNAALELAGILNKKGWWCKMENLMANRWRCSFHCYVAEHEATDANLATAICRAFVAVMEGRK